MADVHQHPADQDIDPDESDYEDPCQEDELFFQLRLDAATMEEAICKLMDGMEAQERCDFKEVRQQHP